MRLKISAHAASQFLRSVHAATFAKHSTKAYKLTCFFPAWISAEALLWIFIWRHRPTAVHLFVIVSHVAQTAPLLDTPRRSSNCCCSWNCASLIQRLITRDRFHMIYWVGQKNGATVFDCPHLQNSWTYLGGVFYILKQCVVLNTSVKSILNKFVK